MVRREIVTEGVQPPGGYWIAYKGSLTWGELVPIVDTRLDIRDGLVGFATEFRRDGNVISCDIPDDMDEGWEYGPFVNQNKRATGRKGGTIILSGDILALMVLQNPYPSVLSSKEKK